MKLLRVLEFALNRPYKGQMTPTRVFDLWEVICSFVFLPERFYPHNKNAICTRDEGRRLVRRGWSVGVR